MKPIMHSKQAAQASTKIKMKKRSQELSLAAWVAFVFVAFFLSSYFLSSRHASFLSSLLSSFLR